MPRVSGPRTTPAGDGRPAAARRRHRARCSPATGPSASSGACGSSWCSSSSDHHGISDARIGVCYTCSRSTAVGVMLLVAPRLQPLALSTTVPLSLGSLSRGHVRDRATCRPARSCLAFAVVGVGQRPDRRLPERRRAASRGRGRTSRSCSGCTRRTRSAAITGATVAGAIRAADIDFRVGLALRGRRRSRSPPAGRRRPVPRERHVEGDADAVLDLGAVPGAEAPGAGARRARPRS